MFSSMYVLETFTSENVTPAIQQSHTEHIPFCTSICPTEESIFLKKAEVKVFWKPQAVFHTILQFLNTA